VGFWQNDHAELIPNALGKPLAPSVVSVEENGDILIGEAAKERLVTHPAETVTAFKRYMGSRCVNPPGQTHLSPGRTLGAGPEKPEGGRRSLSA
jgi:molecular chaperone HscC